MAQDVIPSIAERYHVSVDAARAIERSLRASGGRQAQFDHPELGGHGQWMPSMIQIGRPNDYQLRARVEGLCAELAAIVRGEETSAPLALGREPGTPSAGACVSKVAGESWWPATFGHPGSAGEQNGCRYAYFPDRDRLLVQMGATVIQYDTAGRRITGVAQQQSHESKLTFTSPEGEVPVEDLACVPWPHPNPG